MALLVLLLSAEDGDVPLGSTAVEALARLGVTSISLARDEQTAVVILEGWAFDPARPEPAMAALNVGTDKARALQPMLQMAVAAAAKGGI